ncbi:G2/mitotic-specific cyclin-B1 [Lemmus lemmus]
MDGAAGVAAWLWPRPRRTWSRDRPGNAFCGNSQRQWEESECHERTNEERASRGLNSGPADSTWLAAEERLLVSAFGQPEAGFFAAGLRASSSGGAMALRVTRSTKLNTENKAKVSMAGAKRVPVALAAASKPGVDNPSPSPMETSGCAPAEEYLCQAFSDVILAVSDVDADDGADPNLCSEYVKDIYAYLRQLEVDVEQHTLAKYLMELTMLDYDMVHFPPSQIAAGAFCLALKILDNGEWTPTLQHYLSYTEESLLPVMQHLAKNIVTVNRGLTKHMTVKNKYATSKHAKVSTLAQLNCTLVQNLSKAVAKA